MAAAAVGTRVAAGPVRARSGLRLAPSTVVFYVLALLALVALLGPLVWMFGTALKEQSEVFTWPPSVFPKLMHWDNFVQAWNGAHFSRYFINSTVVSVVSVLTNVFLGAMAGYAFARLRFPGRNFLFVVVMITLMVPNAVLIIPLFLMMKNVPFTDPGGWLNTYQGVILPTAVTGFSIFLMRQFLQGIPRELDQAAAVDGAHLFQVFWHVMLPLHRPDRPELLHRPLPRAGAPAHGRGSHRRAADAVRLRAVPAVLRAEPGEPGDRAQRIDPTIPSPLSAETQQAVPFPVW